MEWIKFGFPWERSSEVIHMTPIPDVTAKVLEKFSTTEAKEWSKVSKLWVTASLTPEQQDALSVYEKIRDEIHLFVNSLPEIIQWWEIYKQEEESVLELEKNTFRGRGLNKPGTLVKVRNKNGSESLHLIGSINEMRGVCSDFCAFSSDDIVVEYAVIDLPSEIQELLNAKF